MINASERRTTASTNDEHRRATTYEDVVEAANRLRPHIRSTPMVWSESLGAWLKLETLQLTGSYKVRGAMNAILKRHRDRGTSHFVAASAGNHAQGVALAARKLGVQATVVMPESVPTTKRRGTERLGAKVVCKGDGFEEAQRLAHEIARTRGAFFLSPFDDPDVIAGQGTVGMEVASSGADVVLVPIGGGGLASGVGLALKSRGVRVVGVQVDGVDSMARRLFGHPPLMRPAPTVADGVRVRAPGELTTSLCRELLDDVVVVSEQEVHSAMVRLADEVGIIAEGAGALAVAGLNKDERAPKARRRFGGQRRP